MAGKRPLEKIVSIASGPISLVPFEDKNNVQYYKIITHAINGRVLKRKLAILATIRRTTRNCTIAFQGGYSLTPEDYYTIHTMFMHISRWDYWYNFKREKWYGTGLPKQEEAE